MHVRSVRVCMRVWASRSKEKVTKKCRACVHAYVRECVCLYANVCGAKCVPVRVRVLCSCVCVCLCVCGREGGGGGGGSEGVKK